MSSLRNSWNITSTTRPKRMLSHLKKSGLSHHGWKYHPTLALAQKRFRSDPFTRSCPRHPRPTGPSTSRTTRKSSDFVAQLDTRAPEDRERLFIVSYYLADDTIIVYEPPARNSGIMGGKFMERSRIKMPGSSDFYTARDLFVGQMIEFRKHKFRLIEADEYTLNFMENKKFPASDVSQIFEKLKEKLRESSASIRKAFREVDSDHSGYLSKDEFRKITHMYNFDLSDQELISVMRKFDKNYDGVVKYDEFCDAVLEQDYSQVESHGGGQILHGENAYNKAENKINEGKMLE